MIELFAFLAIGGAIAGIRGLVKGANRPARGRSLSRSGRGSKRGRSRRGRSRRSSLLVTAYNSSGARQTDAADVPEALARLSGKAVGGTVRAGGRLTGRAGGAVARVSGRRWERRTHDRETAGDGPWPLLRRVDTGTRDGAQRPEGGAGAGAAAAGSPGEVQVFVPLSGSEVSDIARWRPWIAESVEDAQRDGRPPGQPVFLDEETARAYAEASGHNEDIEVVSVATRPLRFPGKTAGYLSQETTADLAALQQERQRDARRRRVGAELRVQEAARPTEPTATPASASGPVRLAVAPETPDRRVAGQATDEGGNPMVHTAPAHAAGDSAAAAAPGDFAQVIGRIANYEPENDTDLLRFMAGETAGVCGYADAMGQLYETCVNSIGLDPSAVQGLADYASTMTEAAESMTKAHRQFLTVYQEVMAAAERGVVMPHSGRFITGQSA